MYIEDAEDMYRRFLKTGGFAGRLCADESIPSDRIKSTLQRWRVDDPVGRELLYKAFYTYEQEWTKEFRIAFMEYRLKRGKGS